MDVRNINVINLAYLGDAVYELYVRSFLVEKYSFGVNDLSQKASSFVTAKRQSYYVNVLLEENFFTEEEVNVIKRARNYKRNMHPKNTDIVTYKWATGLEALIGYLYLVDKNRLEKVMTKILEKGME